MKKIVLLGFLMMWYLPIIGQEPNDCVNAITVCGNGNFMSNASGIGNIQEVSGCGGLEHNSIWLEINIVQSGTLGFNLIPLNTDISVDYDFWVYSPNALCGSLGSPIRCATTNPMEAGLSSNLTGINGSTTATQTGPGANGNGYVYWLNVLAGQSYYIAIDRPEGDGGFEIEWTGTAMNGDGAFPVPPNANEIDDLKACSSNPNIAIFDLNSVKSDVNSDLINNTVDFYASLADAIDGVNPLPPIYANTTNPQQIYAKVTANGSNCYSLVDFNLIVTPIPEAMVSASSNAICAGETVDFTITGTPNATISYTINNGATQQILLDASGTAMITETMVADTTIELTEAQILNASNEIVCSQLLSESETVTVNANTIPTIVNNSPICEDESGELQFTGEPNATIAYHVDGGSTTTFNLDAAGNYTLTLAGLTATTTVTIESVTSVTAPFCTLQLDDDEVIVVNPLPTVIAPDPMIACDDGTSPNSAPFDLDAQSASISDNAPNVTVSYYETQALALQGDPNDALISPYNSTSASQTVYVRVETDMGCVDYTTLDLQITGAPIANTPVPLEDCDINSQGFGTFDLTQSEAEITAGNTQPVQLSYYTSLTDAENGQPQITNPTNYQNTIPYNETVFVRVNYQSTDCHTIVALDLEVFDTPSIGNIEPYSVCDTDQDGFSIFDLTTLYAAILGTQAPSEHTITFYENEGNATLPVGAIGNPQNYQNTVTGGQTLWVRLEHNTTGCFDIASFNIIADVPLALNSNYVAAVCDMDGDGQYTFNLLDYVSDILANANDPSIYQVDFYPTEQNAINGTAVITTPNSYTSQSSPQEILGVRVSSGQSSCWLTTTLTLEITVLPDPNNIMVGPLQSCDAIAPFDGTEVFDLTQFETTIGAGVPNLNFSYHNSQNDAETGNAPIINPNNHTSATANVFIRVTSANAGNPDCYAVFPLEIIVDPMPILASSGILVCSPNTSGIYAFDLMAEIPTILGSTQNENDYGVAFYEDAAVNNQITTNPYSNTIAYNQTIYVRITDLSSGCEEIFPYELTVEDAATATQPNNIEVCDYDGENDGITEFDLTALDSQVLNGQDPADFSVSYYMTGADANNGTNPITNPTNFQNTIAYNQTIYIRVINNEVPNECYATTTVDLVVYPLLKPEIYSIDGLNTICVDFITGELQNQITLASDIQGSNYTYTWYLDGSEIIGATQGTYTINTASPGLYTVEVSEIQSVSNCTSEISEPYEVIQSGQAVLVAVSQSESFHPNPSITVIVEGYGEYWFQLDDNPIVDNNGVFTNVSGGLHTVTVYDMKTGTPSCDPLIIENIRIIDYPKFLTPNGDGYNDTWNIFALSEQQNAFIKIFDRYGKMLRVIKPAGLGWDGTYHGEKLPSTDYWFVLTYLDEMGMSKEFRAHFSLRR